MDPIWPELIAAMTVSAVATLIGVFVADRLEKTWFGKLCAKIFEAIAGMFDAMHKSMWAVAYGLTRGIESVGRSMRRG